MKQETDLRHRVQLAAGTKCKLFRNNVAQAWVGKSKKVGNDVLIKDARPLKAGLTVGSSDLIGWTEYTVKQEDVGKTIAVFTAVELKTGTVATTPEQLNFIRAILKSGGIAGIARDVADFLNLLRPWQG